MFCLTNNYSDERTLAVGGKCQYSWSPVLLVWIHSLHFIKLKHIFMFGQIQSSQTVDQLYNDPSQYGACSLQ